MKINLETSIGRLKLKNPVMVASGVFGYGNEYKDIVNINALGGVITKTITLEPRSGNPPPRLTETPAGLLNSIGLQNVGIEKFLKEKLKNLSGIRIPIIVSIAGESVGEFVQVAQLLAREEKIAGIELNLSCPNIKQTGKVFAENADDVLQTTSAVHAIYTKPILVKLSPFIADILACAQSAHTAGAEGLTISNTFPGMALDITTRKSKLGTMTGGLSGPAIKPLVLRLVWMIARECSLPIMASGGAATSDDVLEYIIAGASAVAVGTALFSDPQAPGKIITELTRYLRKHQLSKMASLKGSIKCSN